MTDPISNNGSAVPDASSDDRVGERLAAEAHRQLQVATDQPAQAIDDRDRVIELLSMDLPSDSVTQELDRRAAASGALAAIAQETPARLVDRLPVLAAELRGELERTITDENAELSETSRAIRDQLVRSMALAIEADSSSVLSPDGFATFIDGVTTDLTDETLRAAAKALFACADEQAGSLARATDTLEELLAYQDEAVQAWSAGTLGKLAEVAPGAVATTASGLHRLLEHEDGTVQHNALEAMGMLVQERPEAVIPAADTLRELLTRDEAALQHNAAGVLGYLAKTHPEAVIPAIEDLRELCTHDDDAVRRIATGALTRLAEERPGAVTDT